ncbi:hypothetical protein T439DRAFT_333287 [Meredithblackwellia eburnea MCA 4105]
MTEEVAQNALPYELVWTVFELVLDDIYSPFDRQQTLFKLRRVCRTGITPPKKLFLRISSPGETSVRESDFLGLLGRCPDLEELTIEHSYSDWEGPGRLDLRQILNIIAPTLQVLELRGFLEVKGARYLLRPNFPNLRCFATFNLAWDLDSPSLSRFLLASKDSLREIKLGPLHSMRPQPSGQIIPTLFTLAPNLTTFAADRRLPEWCNLPPARARELLESMENIVNLSISLCPPPSDLGVMPSFHIDDAVFQSLLGLSPHLKYLRLSLQGLLNKQALKEYIRGAKLQTLIMRTGSSREWWPISEQVDFIELARGVGTVFRYTGERPPARHS